MTDRLAEIKENQADIKAGNLPHNQSRVVSDVGWLIQEVERLRAAQRVVNDQAEDEALWCHAQYISEAHLQQELRRLHEAVEGKTGRECALDVLANKETRP